MIAQLLNRQFLLEQMESLTQQLSKDVRQERRGGRETEELEPADYREALDHLTKALEKERALSSGQPGYDVAADRRMVIGQRYSMTSRSSAAILS
jgi:hypothetical protein